MNTAILGLAWIELVKRALKKPTSLCMQVQNSCCFCYLSVPCFNTCLWLSVAANVVGLGSCVVAWFSFFSFLEIRLAGSTWTSWITSAGSTGRRELPVNLDTNLDVELYPICWLFWYRSIAFGMQWYWRKGQLHSIGWLDSEYKATDTHSNDGFINLHTVSTNIAPEKCKACIFVDLITWLMRKW